LTRAIFWFIAGKAELAGVDEGTSAAGAAARVLATVCATGPGPAHCDCRNTKLAHNHNYERLKASFNTP